MMSIVTVEKFLVILKGASAEIDLEATELRRAQIRQERLNPMLVLPEGNGLKAADATMILMKGLFLAEVAEM